MSILKTLKLSSAAPADTRDVKQAARTKLLRYLAEQKAIAEAQLAGRAYAATKTVFRTGENGERVRSEAPRHVRRGWFEDDKGACLFQVRYGSKPIELAKGMTSIEVTNLAALPGTIDALVQAVSGGELDEQLNAAVVERRANFRRKTKR